MERPQRPQRPQKPQNNVRNSANLQKQQQDYMQQGNIQQNNMQQNNMGQNSMQNMTPEEQVMLMMQQKKKKRNKVILVILCTILGVSVLGVATYYIATGRISSKVTSLEAEVANLEQTLVDTKTERDNKVQELMQAIEDTTVKELIPTTSLQRVEGSEVPELWLPEGDFIAPNPLELPYTSDGVNDSYVQIGQKFVFRPSDRWSLVSQGATYEFGHPQKIWGKIRALTAKDNIPQEEMQQIVQNFFIGYPATVITYRKVFIDDRIVGMIGKATVTVKYTVDSDSEIEVPVEQVVDVPYEVEEEYEEEVPYTETVTNEDGTTTEVEKTRIEKKTRTVTKTEKKTVTIMEKQTKTEPTTMEKDMVINVGFVQKSDYAISFLFVYDADGGSNSQELVDLLLKSGTFGINGSSLKLE